VRENAVARPRPTAAALLVVAAFSRHADALDWARQRLESALGPVALSGEPFAFDQTDYYQPSMGAGLRKVLWAFRDLIDPASLPDLKLATNAIEQELLGQRKYPEPRPINLDPGYLVHGKFLLATTKDQAHRVYLRDGIFAEVTLHFQAGSFRPWPWTYADYRLDQVVSFLNAARQWYREAAGTQHPAGESS
jgi:hypothetical protein